MECVFLDYDKLLNEIKRIHFIGIGGSGMCPIAEILMSEGYEISGSDMNEGETLDKMKGYGIPVYMGHAAENIKGAELVVYSAAVKETNPERQAAAEQGIPCIERSVMLGVVTRRYRRSIAVSGTHGKTSTTAMLSQILIGSGFDPSAIIGGKLPFIGGNSYVGQSDIIVCEACEYVDTFLELNPFISIILNVDADHLDYFKNLDNIKKSFHQFAKQTTGLLVLNGDDANTLDSVKDVQLEKITFGFGENCDYRAVNVSADKGVHEQYDLYHHGEKLCSVKLIVPGKHNVYNSLAAAATAHYLGATPAEISENLHKFGGVHRRFEILGTPGGVTVADDFAHHPTELTATLNAAMAMGFRHVWAVFQPHTFSRTAMLLDDFAKALQIPDTAIISEILPVRETNTYNIYSRDLGAKVPGSVCLDTFEEITDYVCRNAKEGDLILTMGGGNVYMCANMILKQLEFMQDNV
ncbi:MAG: UDP-N-acetylmuramate--L-alanine ligase [Ruminococcus sp.]|nr:UDP-N-acetylmuramate--L-alanine ligase [Ruminococcus sp.]MBQ4179931.1 UDP-N-acetylmuramate--L-alanine ligase [Ruminococcus sp.]